MSLCEHLHVQKIIERISYKALYKAMRLKNKKLSSFQYLGHLVLFHFSSNAIGNGAFLDK